MRKILTVCRVTVIGVVLCGIALFVSQDDAQARPQYNKAFPKKYSKLATLAKKAKCNVCHVDKQKKKVRNDYGKALAKLMGKKNQKNAEAIDAAFKKAEKQKNKKGKTFGSLIEAGKLPGTSP